MGAVYTFTANVNIPRQNIIRIIHILACWITIRVYIILEVAVRLKSGSKKKLMKKEQGASPLVEKSTSGAIITSGWMYKVMRILI